jgi:hypothetical protein
MGVRSSWARSEEKSDRRRKESSRRASISLKATASSISSAGNISSGSRFFRWLAEATGHPRHIAHRRQSPARGDPAEQRRQQGADGDGHHARGSCGMPPGIQGDDRCSGRGQPMTVGGPGDIRRRRATTLGRPARPATTPWASTIADASKPVCFSSSASKQRRLRRREQRRRSGPTTESTGRGARRGRHRAAGQRHPGLPPNAPSTGCDG